MEIETKYSIKDENTANSIWNCALNGDFGLVLSHETVPMRAVYYDTKGLSLHERRIALRKRSEGERCVATVKWGSVHDDEKGLASRHEVEVEADPKTCFVSFPREILEQDIEGKKLEDYIGGSEFQSMFETNIERRRAEIKYFTEEIEKNEKGEETVKKTECRLELAIDIGAVISGEKQCPISEIEIELLEGDVKQILELSQKIAKIFDLQPEPTSKFAKGIKLFKGEI